MSEIDTALKDKDRDFFITNEERQHLVEILANISVVLRAGKLWFNAPGPENIKHAEFCEEIAHRFANMPVQMEH